MTKLITSSSLQDFECGWRGSPDYPPVSVRQSHECTRGCPSIAFKLAAEVCRKVVWKKRCQARLMAHRAITDLGSELGPGQFQSAGSILGGCNSR